MNGDTVEIDIYKAVDDLYQDGIYRGGKTFS